MMDAKIDTFARAFLIVYGWNPHTCCELQEEERESK